MSAPAFEILALGDAQYMYQVINAISSVNVYGTLGALGALIGLVLMTVQSITQSKMQLQYLLIGIIVFWVMFVPRVDHVMVVELNTPPGYCKKPPPNTPKWLGGCAPRTFVVDNVPAGIAAVGYVVSNIGVKAAQLFDTTFGMPTDESRVATGAVGQNLRLISELRHLRDRGFVDASGLLERIRANTSRYMHDCTQIGVSNGHLTNSQIMHPDVTGDGIPALEGIRYAHPLLTTDLFVKEGGAWKEVTYTCDEGWTKLNTMVQSATDGSLDVAFTNMARPDTIVGTSSGQLEDVFESYASPVAENMQAFMMANIVAAVAGRAALDGPMTSHQTASVIMIEEAAAKRNTQAAGEESIFVRMLRPTMSFFESMFYALAPLMAFVVPMGAFGIKLVFKYLQLTIWVILWYPLLSIVNLFSNMQMKSVLDSLGTDALTPMGSWTVLTSAIDYLGTAATMAAATPAISMTLIFGGPMAMTYLAGRLQGSDMIDEGKMTPDATRTAPAFEQKSVWTGSEAGGVRRTDAPLQSISVSELATNNQQIAESAQQQAMSTFSSVLSNAVKNSAGHTTEGGHMLTGSITKSSVESMDRVVNLMKESGQISTEEYSAYQKLDQSNRAGLAVTVGTPDFIGSSAKGVKDWATTASEGGGASQGTLQSLATKIGSSEAARTSISTSLANAVLDSSGERWSDGVSTEEVTSLQKAAQDVVSTTTNFQEAQSVSQSAGLSETIDASSGYERFIRGGGSLSEMSKRLHDAGLTEEYEQYRHRFDQIPGLTDDAKSMMAGLYAFQRGEPGAGQRDEQAAGSNWMMSTMFVDGAHGTTNVRGAVAAGENESNVWRKRADSAGDAAGAASAIHGSSSSGGEVRGTVAAGLEQTRGKASQPIPDALPALSDEQAALIQQGETQIAYGQEASRVHIAATVDNGIDTQELSGDTNNGGIGYAPIGARANPGGVLAASKEGVATGDSALESEQATKAAAAAYLVSEGQYVSPALGRMLDGDGGQTTTSNSEEGQSTARRPDWDRRGD